MPRTAPGHFPSPITVDALMMPLDPSQPLAAVDTLLLDLDETLRRTDAA